MSDEEVYRLTPFGLISMEIGDESAHRIMDRLELYLRRHYGAPSAIVFDGDGFTFSRLEEGGSDG